MPEPNWVWGATFGVVGYLCLLIHLLSSTYKDPTLPVKSRRSHVLLSVFWPLTIVVGIPLFILYHSGKGLWSAISDSWKSLKWLRNPEFEEDEE
jgi:succinate dehydrogenase hydrophobic anchor subunit